MTGLKTLARASTLLWFGAALAFADENSADQKLHTDTSSVSAGTDSDVETVVVSAIRDRAAAVEKKKQALNLIEVQPLEEMQKLPDVNVAEALQRIPGISVETDTGEGRFVSIRGLDPDLNGTTYGGVRLPPSNPASPFGGARATAFDVLPTGLIGGVELSKTNRPDLDAEALGGTINLVPRRGDAHGGKPFVEATVGGGYEELRNTAVYDFGITTGRNFSRDGDGLFSGADAFSGLLTAIYHEDKRGIDDVEGAYSDQQSAGVPDKLLSEIDQRRYQYHRETYGFAGNFDAKANEHNSFYLRLLWSGYLEHKIDHHLDISGLDSGCVVPDAGAADCTQALSGSSVFKNGFNAPADTANGIPEYDQLLTDLIERIDNQLAVLGGKSIIGAVQLDYHVSIAQGRDRVPYNYGSKFVNPNPVGTVYDNVTNPNYAVFQTTDGTNAADPAHYALDKISLSSSSDRDREWGGQLDMTIPVNYWNAPGQLKFGVNARLRTKTHYESSVTFEPAGDDPILLSAYAGGADQIFYHRLYNIGPPPGIYAIRGLSTSSLVESSGDDLVGDAEAYIRDNENVYAGYGQYTVTFGQFGLLTGLRIESTHATYRAFLVDENADTPIQGLQSRSTSYTDYFPTVQGRYQFSDQLIGRLTYSTAIARPGFNQVTASTIVVDNSVTIGNPNLKPTKGNNFDAALEYYPAPGAIASVGLFAKEFKNYVLPTVEQVGDFSGVDGVAHVQTFSNGSAHAYGGEAAIIDQFQFLPNPFDGLGVSANITLVSSRAEIHPGVSGLLPSTSKVTWNVAPFYEKGPLQLRLAAGFVGQNLFAFGADPGTDVYSRHRLTLDLGASYQIAHFASVYFDAKNLLNTPLEFTEGRSDARPIQREFYETTLLAGVRARF